MSIRHITLRYSDSEDRFFFFLNPVISIISIVLVLSETTLTISDSTGERVSMESEILRVVFLGTTAISEITQLIKGLIVLRVAWRVMG